MAVTPSAVAALQSRIAALEAELARTREELARLEAAEDRAAAENQLLQLRIAELGTALRDRHEGFLDMLNRLQEREEQAVQLAWERAARALAESSERRSRFMAEASSTLTSSLDHEAMLQDLLEQTIPILADWCVADVVEEDRVTRVAVAAADARKRRLLRRMRRRYPPSWDSPQPGVQALREGRLVRVDDPAAVAATTYDAEHLRMLRELDPRSTLAVPLIARGHVLGSITLVYSGSDREHGEEEVELAEELARRAALAVDNARLYEAALVANKAKSDFLAVMSHELRTPLNAIIGYTDLLDAGITGEVNEEQREQLGRVKSSAKHLLQLIEEVLTFARVEARREAVRIETIDPKELVREVAVLIEPLAHERGLGFRTEFPDEPLVLETDPLKLRQILLNILSNAVKFTEEGEIVVAMEPRAGGLAVEMSDTGIGISETNLKRIFDPFWQVEQSRTRRAGGTGLGLAITRKFALLLGGDLTVASEQGKGTTFTLWLPLRYDPDAADAAGLD